MTTPTDADREAFWAIWKWLNCIEPEDEELARKQFMDGDEDDHFILQAFAAHRLLGQRQAIELAAKVADKYGACIALDIRNLAPEAEQ
jgi:hypothetical protein